MVTNRLTEPQLRHPELAEGSPREALDRGCGRIDVELDKRDLPNISLRFARGRFFIALRDVNFLGR